MWNSRQYPEPRWVTREEVAAERAMWPLEHMVARWREKRRRTHKLLKAARQEIRRLRAQLKTV